MIGFSFKSSFPLLLLLALLFHHHGHVLAAPSSQHGLAVAEEKSPLWSWIKTGSVLSSVSRKGGGRGGGGSRSRGGSGSGSGSKSWGGKSGKGGGGRVPLYATAGGAAGVAAGRGPHQNSHSGAAHNSGKSSHNLALVAVWFVVALFFKHFA